MKTNLIVLIVSVGGVILCAAAWLLPPALQDAQAVVDAEASVELERARRLLDEYDAALTHQAILTDRLAEQEIEADPDEVAEDLADEYQEEHATMWEQFPPVEWPEGGEPRRAQARYGNVAGQVRSGLSGNLRDMDTNDEKLDAALAAVERALSITRGDASSQTHAEATWLKASVFYHQALAGTLEAQLKRKEAQRYRTTLSDLAVVVSKSGAAASPSVIAGIDESIAAMRGDLNELRNSLASDRTALADLDGTIADLEARFVAADARAREALAAMDQIKAGGIDFSNPEGAEHFAEELLKWDRAYRKAAREANALRHGDYPYAQIDRSADYVSGQYVENGSPTGLTTEAGLEHFQRERDVLASRLDGRQQAVTVLEQEIARLQGVKQRHERDHAEARQRVTDAIAQAKEAWAELSRVDSEAEVLEDEVLDPLDEAVQVAGLAARYADQWISDARRRAEGLAPEARDESPFAMRERDRWMGGFIGALEADARLAKARVHYARYQSAANNAALLAAVAGPLQLAEADVEAEQAKATRARNAGLAEITGAAQVLESTHGKVERHWTVTAQAATANDLLALFGEEDYTEDALAGYRAAVQGRENQAFVDPFLTRINRLENR